MSAIAVLTWELLARCRLLFQLTAAGLLFLCLLVAALPESWRSPELGVCLMCVLAVPLMFVLGSLEHAFGACLEGTRSLFPKRLFTLPAPTFVLVAPPLLLGTLLVVVCWLLCAFCLLRPCGVAAPLLWPGLVGAATLACLQALVWCPFPLPWLRPVGLFALLPSLVILVVVGAGRYETGMTLGSLVLLLVGYSAALAGVTLGRRGVGSAPALWVSFSRSWSSQRPAAPFRSSLRAEVWMEARRLGSGFFAMGGGCLAATFLLLYMLDFVLGTVHVESLSTDLRFLDEGLAIFGRSWWLVLQVPVIPFLALSAIGGNELGRIRTQPGSSLTSPFQATRPLSTSEMVKAKLLVCAAGVVCLWSVFALATFAWVVWMGKLGEMSDRLVGAAGSDLAALAVLLCGMLLLAIVSWLWLVSGMWVSALRRPLVELLPGVLSVCLLLGGGGLVAWWREEWRPVLGWLVVLALLSKVAAVGWVARRLVLSRLVRGRSLAVASASWLAVTLVAAILALRLTSGDWLAAGAAVLMMPLARPLAAPIALARNRAQ